MGLIATMRPAPTLQLAFQMRTGVGHLRLDDWTETNWVILEKIKTRNNEPLYEYANVQHLYSYLKTPLRHLFLTHMDRERMIFSTQSNQDRHGGRG
jgi:hypothetical protein